MEKPEMIDETQYFTESKKAIQIVLENERLLGKKLKTHDLLQLVKDHKKVTDSVEEFDKLEKLERHLERKIRFNQLNEPAVPEEHQEKIKRNATVEQQEVDKMLDQYRTHLGTHLKYLEDEVIPVLTSIEKLEKLSTIPVLIDKLLTGEIGENTVFKMEYLLRLQNHSQAADRTKNCIRHLKKAAEVMREIGE